MVIVGDDGCLFDDGVSCGELLLCLDFVLVVGVVLMLCGVLL